MEKDIVSLLVTLDRTTGEIKATHETEITASDVLRISKWLSDQAILAVKHVISSGPECGAI